MKKSISIQVQAVLYNNEKQALGISIESLKRAIEVYEKNIQDSSLSVNLCYGDASPRAIFSEEEINKIVDKYKNKLSFSYKSFGFNLGYGKGHNMLNAGSTTDYVLIINPDIILSPRFFIEIIKPFYDESLNVGLVEARQTPIEHPKEYDTVTGETSWASGACMILPTKIFQQINGFDDTTFFMYCEDVDLSWRVRLLGKKIIYQPLAPVFHAKRLSATANWQPTESEIYYSAESGLMLAYKWSNKKLTKEIYNYFKNSKDENHQKVIETFNNRKKVGTLPVPIDKKHQVAEFIDGNYAKHRFKM